ncbi:TPA: site-specific integrase [Bacillus cereus]|uniref:site-specific integrase n=1 Tax=Bacillus cereus group TaxID=86661 RepID=UPI0020B6A5B6|nr:MULTISPECIES: site-specific integrase [unclassified Bacillus cereus group]UTG82111.1 site-specific integrase [Bacillus paranthracis]HDR8205224.1 site-specific integrase [Bacillus cereus]MDA2663575.1 site-specific integrase [Bacillus cereus group sp. Bc032]MDA2674329.1 site-specific integrase [Bacillus cereus group sp. Bc031]MDA2679679.1 site-specific integrase [Bacillus cereus group sp. Bc029]
MIDELESKLWYQELKGKVDDNILVYQDKGGYFWDKVNLEHLRYFKNNSCGYPFTNHLALKLMVISNQNLNPKSIHSNLTKITIGLKQLFQETKLVSLNNFDVNILLSDYLRREILPSHSDSKRSEFFNRYKNLVKSVLKWHSTKLTREQQEVFAPFLLPQTHLDGRDFKVSKTAKNAAKSKRKSETDVISKEFIKIRAEGGFRLNKVRRLRQKYLEVVEFVKDNGYPLPFEFSYIENEERGDRSKELFSFRLWDKPSFVLHHSKNYSSVTINNAKVRRTTFSEENNEYFVEFLKAEVLDDKTGEPVEETEGFWFLPIWEYQLIGYWPLSLSAEQINEKLKILKVYGYRESDSEKINVPFQSDHKGILAQGKFITSSQKYADGILMNVEVLYITALFGATALDIFTSSGARLGEVAQVHLGIDCLDQVSITDPETNEVKTSYIFRAIPKGRDKLAVFYTTKDTFDLIKEIAFYLRDQHYKGSIPKVEFRYMKEQGESRPDQPYLFQLHGKHFRPSTFAGILNFICFGLIYETQDKKLVKLKPHLLRHGFATHAVQAEDLPIDVVAMILNQKDLDVTKYYSQPTQSQVADVVSDFHTSMATTTDMMKEVLRQPEEIQALFERQREISGPFSKTVGGTCVTNKICPTQLACVGCATKIPEPEQKHELLAYLDWAEKSKEYHEEKGFKLEVLKIKKTIHDAKVELKEIALIEEYRRDKENEPRIIIRKP